MSTSMLGTGDFVELKLHAIGKSFVNGVSNRYDDTYHAEILEGIVSETDFADICRRLNTKLQELWPCGPAYYCGMICSVCTCGFSLFLPHMCVSDAEKAASLLLSNVSMRAKYYDRGITFRLEKSYCLSSHFVVSFPKQLHKDINDIENAAGKQRINTNVSVEEPPTTRLKSI